MWFLPTINGIFMRLVITKRLLKLQFQIPEDIPLLRIDRQLGIVLLLQTGSVLCLVKITGLRLYHQMWWHWDLCKCTFQAIIPNYRVMQRILTAFLCNGIVLQSQHGFQIHRPTWTYTRPRAEHETKTWIRGGAVLLGVWFQFPDSNKDMNQFNNNFNWQ
jgi:hypothetical protein